MKSKQLKQPDTDNIDIDNYKGIYYNNDATKHTDLKTGAHFDFNDICQRLIKIKQIRDSIPAVNIAATKASRNVNNNACISNASNKNVQQNRTNCIKAIEANLKILCNKKLVQSVNKPLQNKSSLGIANTAQYNTKSNKKSIKILENKENSVTIDKKLQEQMYNL